MFKICAIYRPSSGNVGQFIEETLEILTQSNTENSVVLVGDVNSDVSNISKTVVSDYLDILFSYKLENAATDYAGEEYLNGNMAKIRIHHV